MVLDADVADVVDDPAAEVSVNSPVRVFECGSEGRGDFRAITVQEGRTAVENIAKSFRIGEPKISVEYECRSCTEVNVV